MKSPCGTGVSIGCRLEVILSLSGCYQLDSVFVTTEVRGIER